MFRKILFAIIAFCVTTHFAKSESEVVDSVMSDINTEDIVSVVKNGIKNEGTPIGGELNRLVVDSYGKTLYFPAGVYNLTEPIVLPFDYTKNVNIIFDKNALIKTDIQLEALLKVGYTEMSTPDRGYRRFSFIEGGKFDCSLVDNGIMVNGLKQLVSLKDISLFKGRKTHIHIHVTDDFKGTGSSDTKIDNITIQGISSNEEVYGIYIDHSCCDIKISNTFIYGTKYAIYTKSAGHFLNNIHILAQVTTGGLNRGTENFIGTEGIHFDSGGFFILHEIYFDTVDKAIVISPDKNPSLIIDKNIHYSYLKNFGTSFIYRDNAERKPFCAKISNSIFEMSKVGYKIFDVHPMLPEDDLDNYFSFINNTRLRPHLTSPYDVSLSYRLSNKTSNALVLTSLNQFDTGWHALGALMPSVSQNKIRIELSSDCAVELCLVYKENKVELVDSQCIGANKDRLSFEFGYVIKNDCCVLFFKPQKEYSLFPVITDLSGHGALLSTPSKDKHYRLADYDITETPVILLKK